MINMSQIIAGAVITARFGHKTLGVGHGVFKYNNTPFIQIQACKKQGEFGDSVKPEDDSGFKINLCFENEEGFAVFEKQVREIREKHFSKGAENVEGSI